VDEELLEFDEEGKLSNVRKMNKDRAQPAGDTIMIPNIGADFSNYDGESIHISQSGYGYEDERSESASNF